MLRQPVQIPFTEKDQHAPVARFCDIDFTAGGSVSWDSAKIRCSLSPEERSDELFLRNLVHGTVLSGKFWPLIFDAGNNRELPRHIKFRSIAFFQSLIRDPAVILKSLCEEDYPFFIIGVRDLWLANSYGLLRVDQREPELLQQVLSLLDEDSSPSLFVITEVNGIGLSLCPTKSRRVLRFVDSAQLAEDIDVSNLAARVPLTLSSSSSSSSASSTSHSSVFSREKKEVQYACAFWVDPRDLSYHNFECILPLDRVLLHNHSPSSPAPPLLDFSFSNMESHSMGVLTARLTGKDVSVLREIDSLSLYQRPANSSTRGGQRFIFSSSLLSQSLTAAFKASALYWELRSNVPFVKVNEVFRMNRFSPHDDKFTSHLDTPFFDASRTQISRNTLLIYLTAGKNQKDSVLSLKNGFLKFDRFEEMTCVIFNQSLEHEAFPYEKDDKIFLRTELIYNFQTQEEYLQRDAETAALFSSAVYFSMQSMFQPEYSRYAHDLYERVNRAHWAISSSSSSSPSQPPMLHKRWKRGGGIHFATNGFDYFFPFVAAKDESPLETLKTFALIAVIDYFNSKLAAQQEAHRKELEALRANANEEDQLLFCFIEEEVAREEEARKQKEAQRRAPAPHDPTPWQTFRKDCATEEISPPSSASSPTCSQSEWVLQSLWKAVGAETEERKRPFVPIEKTEKEHFMESAVDIKPEYNDSDRTCCPSHYGSGFVPWKSELVHRLYAGTVSYAKRQLQSSTLLLLDSVLRIDFENILVSDDKIFLNSANPHAKPFRVNFASCWNSNFPVRYVKASQVLPSPRFLLPPIMFIPVPERERVHGAGFHLMFDFFRNDFVIPKGYLERNIPIPAYKADHSDRRTLFTDVIEYSMTQWLDDTLECNEEHFRSSDSVVVPRPRPETPAQVRQEREEKAAREEKARQEWLQRWRGPQKKDQLASKDEKEDEDDDGVGLSLFD